MMLLAPLFKHLETARVRPGVSLFDPDVAFDLPMELTDAVCFKSLMRFTAGRFVMVNMRDFGAIPAERRSYLRCVPCAIYKPNAEIQAFARESQWHDTIPKAVKRGVVALCERFAAQSKTLTRIGALSDAARGEMLCGRPLNNAVASATPDAHHYYFDLPPEAPPCVVEQVYKLAPTLRLNAYPVVGVRQEDIVADFRGNRTRWIRVFQRFSPVQVKKGAEDQHKADSTYYQCMPSAYAIAAAFHARRELNRPDLQPPYTALSALPSLLTAMSELKTAKPPKDAKDEPPYIDFPPSLDEFELAMLAAVVNYNAWGVPSLMSDRMGCGMLWLRVSSFADQK
jgi:hypothetical protein